MAKSDAAPLTAAQREIMQIIWERGEATVNDVREALPAKRRDLARNTVQTMISRLEEKGWLKHREEGRTFIYSANRPRSISLGARVALMVDRLFAGSAEEMVNALIEYRGLSDDEADRIREMIEAKETKPKGDVKREKKS
ncbi:MAG: BlaI/MecI/CopY family transcriptional regulator [Planctomycetaceae bacterium]